MNRDFAKKIMLASLGLISGAVVCISAVGVVHNIEMKEQIRSYCQQDIGMETWYIKARIQTVGEVSPEKVTEAADIIRLYVPTAAWNYLNATGGRLVIVEGDDVLGYVLDNYNTSVEHLKGKKALGYTAKICDINGDLERVDVIMASEGLTALLHEFGHVVDYTYNYSSSKEFSRIFGRAEGICRKLYKDDIAVAYFSERPTEFFAEMLEQYQFGTLDGVDEDLEVFLSHVHDDVFF